MRICAGMILATIAALTLLTGVMLVAGHDRALLAAWDRIRCDLPELPALSLAQCGDTPTLAEAKPVVILVSGCDRPMFAASTELDCVGERTPRIVFMHAAWCAPCRAALEGPQAFPRWLMASGWKVGHEATDHVQLVDHDARRDLVAHYGVKTLPAMVRITQNGHEPPVPYTGRESLIRLLKPNNKPELVGGGE